MTESPVDGGTNRCLAHPAVLFVCLHGSAKSLIAAEYFNRLARRHGLPLRAESVGIEPDRDVPEAVVEGLARDGIDVRGYAPCLMDPTRLEAAPVVVSFGCELPGTVAAVRAEHWDDVPMVSEGFDRARDVIVARVERLMGALG